MNDLDKIFNQTENQQENEKMTQIRNTKQMLKELSNLTDEEKIEKFKSPEYKAAIKESISNMFDMDSQGAVFALGKTLSLQKKVSFIKGFITGVFLTLIIILLV